MYFCPGELAEWSIAAVLKTVEPRGSGGSNPSLSAKEYKKLAFRLAFFCFQARQKLAFESELKTKKAKDAKQLSFLYSLKRSPNRVHER